mmetsp:Transcript_55096/g.128573  ORF Transcript_55096/g.128573 Transcript_55096/m.128573 type:complete len:654 (-) Transcript_55096:19-1980(-)
MASSFQQIQAQQDLESLSLSPASSSLGSPHSGSESSNREPVVVIHNTFISLRADGKPAKSLKKSASDSTLHCPTPASSVVYEAPQHGGGSVSRPNSCVNSTCDADDLDKFIEPGQEEQHHEELQARLEVQALREQFWARLSLTEKDDPPEPINVEEPAELPRFLDRPVAQTSHWLRSPDSPVTQSTEMPASLLVMKFGGTSLASAQHLLRCASIVRKALPSRPVVVVSAMGKTTNALLQASKTALELGEVDISPIRKIHEQAMEELGVAVPESMAELLNELEKVLNGVALLKEISMQTRDRIVSFGERLSVRAFAAAFNSSRTEPKEVDARPIDAWQIGMRTTSGAGSADSAFSSAEILGESRSAIEHHLGPLRQHYGHVPIVTGNIAQDAKNVITTLGRDGSDLTAAVIGAAVKASEVQIWKDVSGVQTTDPRVISAAKPVHVLTFEEAAELSTFGSKVVHPAAVIPAWSAGVPMSVKNSMAPDLPGTRIVPALGGSDVREGRVAAISSKKNITMIVIRSSRMLGQHGFLAHVFQVFNKFAASVDVIATSEVTVSLTLDEGYKHVDLHAIEEELREVAKVSVLHDMSMLTLITAKTDSVSVLRQSFQAFEEMGISVEMVSHGASNVNVTFVLPGSQLLTASQKLHRIFFETA